MCKGSERITTCKCGVDLCHEHNSILANHKKSCYLFPYAAIEGVNTFNFTNTHLKLLRNFSTYWNNVEYGAPAVSPKKPYGNSDIEDDIRDILQTKLSDNKCYKIHRSLGNALDIFLQHAVLPEGKYIRKDEYSEWKKADQ